MTDKITVACIQNCATPDVDENIRTCRALATDAIAAGAGLIALPEYFSGIYTEGPDVHPVAFHENSHPVLAAFSDLARDHGVNILLGSLGVKSADGRIFNRAFMLGRDGGILAQYDKIHMFDVDLGPGKKVCESATIAPGSKAVIASFDAVKMGLSICYDLRFAYLYRALAKAGANVLAVPAAFMKQTGKAHWHVLNRARAIETGSFVIAPCQTGTLSGGAECYGHSLIVNPWGEVLADGGEETGFVMASVDLREVQKARTRIPALTHDRSFSL